MPQRVEGIRPGSPFPPPPPPPPQRTRGDPETRGPETRRRECKRTDHRTDTAIVASGRDSAATCDSLSAAKRRPSDVGQCGVRTRDFDFCGLKQMSTMRPGSVFGGGAGIQIFSDAQNSENTGQTQGENARARTQAKSMGGAPKRRFGAQIDPNALGSRTSSTTNTTKQQAPTRALPSKGKAAVKRYALYIYTHAHVHTHTHTRGRGGGRGRGRKEPCN